MNRALLKVWLAAAVFAVNLSWFFEDWTPALVAIAASVFGAHASLKLGIAVSATVTIVLLSVRPKRGSQPHRVEARKRSRHDGWAVRCSRCGWLRGVPKDRSEALRLVNEHHAVFGGSMLVRTNRRWWR